MAALKPQRWLKEVRSPERDGTRDPLTNVQTGNWAMRFSNHVSDAFIHQSL